MTSLQLWFKMWNTDGRYGEMVRNRQYRKTCLPKTPPAEGSETFSKSALHDICRWPPPPTWISSSHNARAHLVYVRTHRRADGYQRLEGENTRRPTFTRTTNGIMIPDDVFPNTPFARNARRKFPFGDESSRASTFKIWTVVLVRLRKIFPCLVRPRTLHLVSTFQ